MALLKKELNQGQIYLCRLSNRKVLITVAQSKDDEPFHVAKGIVFNAVKQEQEEFHPVDNQLE